MAYLCRRQRAVSIAPLHVFRLCTCSVAALVCACREMRGGGASGHGLLVAADTHFPPRVAFFLQAARHPLRRAHPAPLPTSSVRNFLSKRDWSAAMATDKSASRGGFLRFLDRAPPLSPEQLAARPSVLAAADMLCVRATRDKTRQTQSRNPHYPAIYRHVLLLCLDHALLEPAARMLLAPAAPVRPRRGKRPDRSVTALARACVEHGEPGPAARVFDVLDAWLCPLKPQLCHNLLRCFMHPCASGGQCDLGRLNRVLGAVERLGFTTHPLVEQTFNEASEVLRAGEFIVSRRDMLYAVDWLSHPPPPLLLLLQARPPHTAPRLAANPAVAAQTLPSTPRPLTRRCPRYCLAVLALAVAVPDPTAPLPSSTCRPSRHPLTLFRQAPGRLPRASHVVAEQSLAPPPPRPLRCPPHPGRPPAPAVVAVPRASRLLLLLAAA